MMQPDVKTLVQAATFLSEEERQMLFGITSFWPKEELDNLAQALNQSEPVKPIQASVKSVFAPKKVETASPVPAKKELSIEERIKQIQTPPPPVRTRPQVQGENLVDLKKRLEKQTVDFSAKRQEARIKNQGQPRTDIQTFQASAKNTESVVSDNKYKIPDTNRGRGVEFVNSTEDLATLTIYDLRFGGFDKNLNKLMAKIFEIAQTKQSLAYAVIDEFEKSPIYQSYIQTGMGFMENTTHTTGLSRDEFEKFTDFKQYLDTLI